MLLSDKLLPVMVSQNSQNDNKEGGKNHQFIPSASTCRSAMSESNDREAKKRAAVLLMAVIIPATSPSR